MAHVTRDPVNRKEVEWEKQKTFTFHIKLVSDGLLYHLQLVKSDLKTEEEQTA